MVMRGLVHPGEVIRELCLEPLGLAVTDAVRTLDAARKVLSELLNGRADINPPWRLAWKAFGPSAEYWLAMQQQHYDLSRKRKMVKLGRVRQLVEYSEAAP